MVICHIGMIIFIINKIRLSIDMIISNLARSIPLLMCLRSPDIHGAGTGARGEMLSSARSPKERAFATASSASSFAAAQDKPAAWAIPGQLESLHSGATQLLCGPCKGTRALPHSRSPYLSAGPSSQPLWLLALRGREGRILI